MCFEVAGVVKALFHIEMSSLLAHGLVLCWRRGNLSDALFADSCAQRPAHFEVLTAVMHLLQPILASAAFPLDFPCLLQPMAARMHNGHETTMFHACHSILDKAQRKYGR